MGFGEACQASPSGRQAPEVVESVPTSLRITPEASAQLREPGAHSSRQNRGMRAQDRDCGVAQPRPKRPRVPQGDCRPNSSPGAGAGMRELLLPFVRQTQIARGDLGRRIVPEADLSPPEGGEVGPNVPQVSVIDMVDPWPGAEGNVLGSKVQLDCQRPCREVTVSRRKPTGIEIRLSVQGETVDKDPPPVVGTLFLADLLQELVALE